jgi:hypothetical protein
LKACPHARTASRRIPHLALKIIGLLRGFETFGDPEFEDVAQRLGVGA